jgi:GntR family transcriptional regulator / MocR family aminotransferase
MLWLPIDRTSEIPLIKQVYNQIRSLILRGAMKSGDKLPSTRDLASNLNVSRNVILEAYDLLIAEGYIISSLGSGTYIADGVFLEQPKTKLQAQSRVTFNPDIEQFDLVNFQSGIPDLELLPRKKWSQLEQQICLDSPPKIFGYDSPEGRIELREALCCYLKKSRGVECQLDQIIVTSGAVQGLSILSRALLSPERSYIIEDPIHREIRNIFAVNSSNIYPISVDEYGLKTELLPKNLNPVLVMLTPSHQYPLGVILPVQRRIELIQYARSNGCYIIEDDYDSEFRYEGPPISSLQGLDPNWVIYIGSFSKILFPALRLGYMVVPTVLIEQCRVLKHLQDNHTPILAQLSLARFIEEGYLEKHITKMKKIYRHKRDVLITNLRDAFHEHIIISGQSTGLHLIAEFEGIIFTEEMIALIKKTGVIVHPVEEHAFIKGFHLNKIIIGYSHLSHQEIEKGVTRLKKAINI